MISAIWVYHSYKNKVLSLLTLFHINWWNKINLFLLFDLVIIININIEYIYYANYIKDPIYEEERISIEI